MEGWAVSRPERDTAERQPWIEPEIRELDVRETSVAPHLGADVGGNPFPDCQHS
jgi:hypothetical protein